MVLITEIFLEAAVESWPEWRSKVDGVEINGGGLKLSGRFNKGRNICNFL